MERNRPMTNRLNWHGRAGYLIKVKGLLDDRWSDWFGGLKLTSEADLTIMNGEVSDQAALYAVLVRIRDLGLPLIAVERKEADRFDEEMSGDNSSDSRFTDTNSTGGKNE